VQADEQPRERTAELVGTDSADVPECACPSDLGVALGYAMVTCRQHLGTPMHDGYGDASAPQRLGHAFIAVAVDHVQSRDAYATRIADFTNAVHSSAAEGSLRPPLVPGEPEAQRLRDLEAWAIEVTTLRQYVNLAQELNVKIPDAVSSLSVAGVWRLLVVAVNDVAPHRHTEFAGA